MYTFSLCSGVTLIWVEGGGAELPTERVIRKMKEKSV